MTDAMWLMDRGDTENAKASISGRGRDINDFAYQVKWNDLTFKYEWVGDKVEIERNENRKQIINAMKRLYEDDKEKNLEVRPNQVYKILEVKPQSKEAKNIARTMLRMAEGGEINKGSVYGTYTFYQPPQKDDIQHEHY